MAELNEVLKEKERILLWSDATIPYYDENIKEQCQPNIISYVVENSLMLASELSRNKIPFEIHTFFEGGHGLGLAEKFENINMWTKLCENWMRKSGYLEEK